VMSVIVVLKLRCLVPGIELVRRLDRRSLRLVEGDFVLTEDSAYCVCVRSTKTVNFS